MLNFSSKRWVFFKIFIFLLLFFLFWFKSKEIEVELLSRFDLSISALTILNASGCVEALLNKLESLNGWVQEVQIGEESLLQVERMI